MSFETLRTVLEATGYLPNGEPAPGVLLGESARANRQGRLFVPDASWRGQSTLTVYFKHVDISPNENVLGSWRREVWNEGFAPLLWVISPERIDLYNGFGRPQVDGDAARYLLRTFRNIDQELDELDALAGRLAMETGQFWQTETRVNRKTSVDRALLSDLAFLERDLVETNLDRSAAQALIGRSIFTQYLIDRGILHADRLEANCGDRTLPSILRNPASTERLFAWLSDTFNGDMFPPSTAADPAQWHHLQRVADFLDAVDPVTGQHTLFPYQFDVIPVELISTIYEQFAHAVAPVLESHSRSSEASLNGVYYTRLPVVALVLDEVMNNLTGRETVLDLTCGSGVFLVEALRRLVQFRTGGRTPSRKLIRSILHSQIFGVDISEAAIRVAAFSLYLAALELDPDPQPIEALRFQPLIGKTLFVGDARTVEATRDGAELLKGEGNLKTFDLIIGNPPWSFKGSAGTAERRRARAGEPIQPRGVGLDFVVRALDFAHGKTRIGMILSAMPFFSGSKTGALAARHVVEKLAPVTLVNLSNLRSWLFPGAKMPAVALFARHRAHRADMLTVVQVPWSPTGAKTHTFEIAPSDITLLPLAAWAQQPVRLKIAAIGRRRDLLLFDTLISAYAGLDTRLAALGVKLNDGLILGKPDQRTNDASFLTDLPFLQADNLRHFGLQCTLSKFGHRQAQWPRSRDVYRAPVLLVKEFLGKAARPISAVSESDLVFSDAFFGAAFPSDQAPAAHLLAGILCSALASWFFVMTASEFGVWKQRLFRQDVALLPIPDLEKAARTPAGRRVLDLEKGFQREVPAVGDWAGLDEAVFDLYNLDATDRVVVRDGLFRASWEWQAGAQNSYEPAEPATDLQAYARTFLTIIDAWLSARKRRRMRAEIFDLPSRDALRVVRFVLEERPGPSVVEVVSPDMEIAQLLTQIGHRLKVKLASSLIGQRELRVHGSREVVIIKPAARRHWMGASALEDADAVIAESIAGAPD